LFKFDDRGRYFRAQGIGDLEELNRALETVIQAAEEQNVHLVVLPELMVPPAARDTLVQRLSRRTLSRPYGVLAGSFHIPAGIPAGPNQTGEAPLFNEACLLDHRGRRVLCHQKQFGFRLRRREALPPFFPGGPPKGGMPAEIYEDIEDGAELAILDTTLGRLAMLICFDALAADPDHGFEELIRRVRPDLLFVLSMSPKTRPFEEVFKRMAEHWIGTAYVNAHCVCRRAKGSPERSPLLACCDLALQEPGGAAPTRVLWRIGQDQAQCIYYGDGPHPESTGVEVHPALGLILDLGVHLKASAPG
jgi:predicted amidohydrolase